MITIMYDAFYFFGTTDYFVRRKANFIDTLWDVIWSIKGISWDASKL